MNEGWSVRHLYLNDTMTKAEEQKVETTKNELEKVQKVFLVIVCIPSIQN